jgi:predicted nucleic acid-binding protein
MRLLLDTNAYSAMKRGDLAVADLVRGAERILLSTVVAGELLHGFRAGSRWQDNLRELHAFLDHPLVHVCQVDLETADRFARIVTDLRRVGKPIPTNDVWIAAHAMQTGARLVSFDRHFEVVAGLALLVPASP